EQIPVSDLQQIRSVQAQHWLARYAGAHHLKRALHQPRLIHVHARHRREMRKRVVEIDEGYGGERDEVRSAGERQISPRFSSQRRIASRDASTVSRSVRTVISAETGGSYGSEMPLKFGISPRISLADN